MTQKKGRFEGFYIAVFGKVLPALLIMLLSLTGCDETPTGRNQLSLIPDKKLESMGTQAFTDLKRTRPRVADPRVNGYIACLVKSIISAMPASDQKWEVVVFDDPSPNAFALPGRKIGINSGMLSVAKSQGQLAAVIAHEVGHVLANHANERMTQQLAIQGGLALFDLLSEQREGWKHEAIRKVLDVGAGVGILLPFSRIHEKEADTIGLDLMARAGFDPEQSLALWQNMARLSEREPIEFLSTHPSHETRYEELQKQMDPSRQLFEQAKSLGRQPRCK
jgi:predicted Zn-dependent protease